jgi:CubicO group peptidase (beta-lactamase class C family)
MDRGANECDILLVPLRTGAGCLAALAFLLLLRISLFAVSSRPQHSGNDEAGRYSRIDHLFRSEFAQDNRGGLTVGVFEKGRLSWTAAYGFANEEAGTPATANDCRYALLVVHHRREAIMFRIYART